MNVKTHLLKELSVLYVEDDAEIAEAVRFTFENQLRNLAVMPTAEDAFDYFMSFRPDIVITESVLPFTSGLELAKNIKNISPDTPIMIVSAERDIKTLVSAIEINVECYLMKPVNLREMKRYMSVSAEKIYKIRAAERNRNLLKRILDNSREMYLAGSKDDISYMNCTLLEFFGYSSLEETDGIKNVEVIENRRSESPVPFPLWLKSIKSTEGYETVVTLMRKGMLKSDGKTFIARVTRIEEEDGYAVSLIDVTVMELQKKFFSNLAMKDPLTEILNRQKFSEEFNREIIRSRRYGTKIALIMFDIDKFCTINEKFGLQAGDGVLKELARLVSENIRTTDIFARYGGEEFIIMTPEVGIEGALMLAEKLRKVISEHKFEIVESVECSFGVAGYEAGLSGEEFIRAADEALFRAKGKGRNAVSD